LLEEEPLQSFMKHQVLKRYGMVFTQKLSRGGQRLPVVLVDGYAGTGRYKDGTPASSEILLQAAVAAEPGSTFVELVEPDEAFQPSLNQVADEYRCLVAGNPAFVTVSQGTVQQHLPAILRRASGRHLFLFLDPCGAGLSFDEMVQLHGRDGGGWPRTEILLNFSGHLVRRVGAKALKTTAPSVLDRVCGGPWWRDSLTSGRALDDSTWEAALSVLVRDYVDHLANALPGSTVMAVPVKKKYTGQPVFYLVHTTTSGYGLWAMSDAVARATRVWREEHDLRENHGQGSLFDPEDVVTSFEDASERVRQNLLRAAGGTGSGRRLPEIAGDVLDDAVGALTETDIARIVRDLDGKQLRLDRGKKPDQYRIYPL